MDRWDYIKAGILFSLEGLGLICFIHDWYVDATYCHESYCDEKSMSGYDYCFEHRYSDYNYRKDQEEFERRYKKAFGTYPPGSSK